MMQVPSSTIDRTSDIFCSQYRPLQPLFAPRSVAVIGASLQVGTVGHTLLWNLVSGPFQGAVFPVVEGTPAPPRILDMPAYTSIRQVPDRVDLALIVAPLPMVPRLLKSCLAADVPAAVLVSEGFRESGPVDPTIEHEIQTLVAASTLRLLGPNSSGLMNPRSGLNATLASSLARPGNIGFVSQSGALCRAILDWSFREQVGFSAFLTMGSMLDLGWGDVIRYLGDDPHTESIILHMEAVGDARGFLAAAREVALTKPIILLKAGRTAAASRAAVSHTGGEAISDAVFSAALQRCGVLQVNRISELFNMAEVLAKRQLQVQGPRLGVVTNSGGLGVLVVDALVAEGGELAELEPDTLAQLNQVLPAEWSQQNPIDILGDADGQRYQRAVEIAAQDGNTDGLLVILTPQGAVDPTDTAEKLKETVSRLQTTSARPKPILASWMGGAEVLAGEAILNRHQIPTYGYPDSAARLFNLMWRHSYSLQGLHEMPLERDSAPQTERTIARQLLRQVRRQQRTTLTPVEAARLLGLYDIPVLPTGLAISEEEAMTEAEMLGYPVVLKLPFKPGAHTPDEGGVQMNLGSPEAVRLAFRRMRRRWSAGATAVVQPMLLRDGSYELVLSSEVDPQFGPVVRFGQGGRLQQVNCDQAVALPPLTPLLARRMIEQTRIYRALSGQRGYPPVNRSALADVLVRFSQMVTEQPWIRTIHINPLRVRPDWSQLPGDEQSAVSEPQLMVLDAHVELHPLGPVALPRPALAAYPSRSVHRYQRRGTTVTLRPLRPTDCDRTLQFYQTLTTEPTPPEGLPSLDHRTLQDRLKRLCCLDYDQDWALAAFSPSDEIWAIGRLSRRQGATAEVALLARSAALDIAADLLHQLVVIAQDQGLQRLVTYLSPAQRDLRSIYERQEFHLSSQGDSIRAERCLAAAAPLV